MSLAVALGGLLGNLIVPQVVRVAGRDGGFLAVAAVVLLSAGLCLRLPGNASEQPHARVAGGADVEGDGRVAPGAGVRTADDRIGEVRPRDDQTQGQPHDVGVLDHQLPGAQQPVHDSMDVIGPSPVRPAQHPGQLDEDDGADEASTLVVQALDQGSGAG
jgi:hypothetical protein